MGGAGDHAAPQPLIRTANRRRRLCFRPGSVSTYYGVPNAYRPGGTGGDGGTTIDRLAYGGPFDVELAADEWVQETATDAWQHMGTYSRCTDRPNDDIPRDVALANARTARIEPVGSGDEFRVIYRPIEFETSDLRLSSAGRLEVRGDKFDYEDIDWVEFTAVTTWGGPTTGDPDASFDGPNRETETERVRLMAEDENEVPSVNTISKYGRPVTRTFIEHCAIPYLLVGVSDPDNRDLWRTEDAQQIELFTPNLPPGMKTVQLTENSFAITGFVDPSILARPYDVPVIAADGSLASEPYDLEIEIVPHGRVIWNSSFTTTPGDFTAAEIHEISCYLTQVRDIAYIRSQQISYYLATTHFTEDGPFEVRAGTVERNLEKLQGLMARMYRFLNAGGAGAPELAFRRYDANDGNKGQHVTFPDPDRTDAILRINDRYWGGLTPVERLRLIAHELSHHFGTEDNDTEGGFFFAEVAIEPLFQLGLGCVDRIENWSKLKQAIAGVSYPRPPQEPEGEDYDYSY